MKARSILVLLVSAGIGTASFAGCGSSSDNTGGTGGSGSTTTGSGSVAGSSVAGPTVSSSGTGSSPGALGAPCTADTQCGMDGRCMLPSGNEPTLGGGPTGGYCTKNCVADADCPGPGSACVKDANMMNGACFLGCSIGPALQYLDDPLDDMKCHGRTDVRCQSLTLNNVDYDLCMPTCGMDTECPAGRVCDPRERVCVDMATMGSPMGDACDAMNPMCAGTCFSFTGGETMCSSYCALGGDITTATDCGGPDKGLCIFSPQGNGAGDFGVCAEACKAHDECQAPAFWCFGIPNLTGSLVDNGWCAGEPACMTQADCMSGTCTDTKYGKFCLDPQWPLGTAAPGTGGAGGAGGGGTGGAGTGGAGTGGMGTGGTGTGGTGGTGG